MADGDAAFFERAYRRLNALMFAIAAAGVASAFFFHGLTAALGFLAGAAFSILNFRWIRQLAQALGSKGPPKKAWRAVMFGARYFLFGLAAYAIVKVFGINILAVLTGLLVAAAAVVLEIIYELVYARA